MRVGTREPCAEHGVEIEPLRDAAGLLVDSIDRPSTTVAVAGMTLLEGRDVNLLGASVVGNGEHRARLGLRGEFHGVRNGGHPVLELAIRGQTERLIRRRCALIVHRYGVDRRQLDRLGDLHEAGNRDVGVVLAITERIVHAHPHITITGAGERHGCPVLCTVARGLDHVSDTGDLEPNATWNSQRPLPLGIGRRLPHEHIGVVVRLDRHAGLRTVAWVPGAVATEIAKHLTTDRSRATGDCRSGWLAPDKGSHGRRRTQWDNKAHPQQQNRCKDESPIDSGTTSNVDH